MVMKYPQCLISTACFREIKFLLRENSLGDDEADIGLKNFNGNSIRIDFLWDIYLSAIYLDLT